MKVYSNLRVYTYCHKQKKLVTKYLVTALSKDELFSVDLDTAQRFTPKEAKDIVQDLRELDPDRAYWCR